MAENEQQQPQFAVQKIYLKDASLESPLGAAVFTKQWNPKFNVDLNTKSDKLQEDTYEVVLTVTLTAKLEEEAALLIEVQQAGIFLVKGVEGEQLRQTLAIAAPNILFPYLREAVDALALKGGFPAVSLQPVNFEALYVQAVKQAQEKAGAAEPQDASH